MNDGVPSSVISPAQPPEKQQRPSVEDGSAMEKIKKAESEAAAALLVELQELEKNLASEEARRSEEFSQYKAALAGTIAKLREKRIGETKEKIRKIQKDGEKALEDIGSSSKKNMGRAVLAFTKIAGSWSTGE